MFTDSPVTPLRIEALVDLFRGLPHHTIKAKELLEMLQPTSLVANQETAREVVRAAKELGVLRDSAGDLQLAIKPPGDQSTRECVLDICESKMLADVAIEKYLAPFYSLMLSMNEEAARNIDWERTYNEQLHPNGRPPNPFNSTKVSGCYRWFGYLGLGWTDPSEAFHCNPYRRVARRLPDVFGGKRKLQADDFFAALGGCCPELDGGSVFKSVAKTWPPPDRRCTLGLSHALLELHEDQVLNLSCPRDSQGWSLDRADPVVGPAALGSDKLDAVELGKNFK